MDSWSEGLLGSMENPPPPIATICRAITRRYVSRAALVASMLLVPSLALARGAPSEVLERVVVTVDDEPIFLSRLRARALAQGLPVDEAHRRALYARALERLVAEQAIDRAIREAELTPSRADVDAAIHNVRVQSGLSEWRFWLAVEEQGFTRSAYRREVSRQLGLLRLAHVRGVRDPNELVAQLVRRAHVVQLASHL